MAAAVNLRVSWTYTAAEQTPAAACCACVLQPALCCARHHSGSRFQPAAWPPLQERLPWPPLLTAEEVQRAQGYYGSGAAMRRVAAKLLAGQPIKARAAGGAWACSTCGMSTVLMLAVHCHPPTQQPTPCKPRPPHPHPHPASPRLPLLQVVTLGGSITRGTGASKPALAYASRFFQLLNASFPHRCPLPCCCPAALVLPWCCPWFSVAPAPLAAALPTCCGWGVHDAAPLHPLRLLAGAAGMQGHGDSRRALPAGPRSPAPCPAPPPLPLPMPCEQGPRVPKQRAGGHHLQHLCWVHGPAGAAGCRPRGAPLHCCTVLGEHPDTRACRM